MYKQNLYLLVLAVSGVFINSIAIAEEHAESSISVGTAGNYSAHAENTDPTGTTIRRDSSREVESTWTGGTEIKSDASETRDPPGLLNKSTSSSRTVVSVNRAGDKKKIASKSIDSSGTLHKRSSTVSVRTLPDGSREVTETTKTVKDPKGLLNRTARATKTTVIRHPDGSVSSAQAVE